MDHTQDLEPIVSITMLEIREELPSIDPEDLSKDDVVTILLHLFEAKGGFINRGHECNNNETAWVNAVLYRLERGRNTDGMESYVVKKVGTSADKAARLKPLANQ